MIFLAYVAAGFFVVVVVFMRGGANRDQAAIELAARDFYLLFLPLRTCYDFLERIFWGRGIHICLCRD